MTINHAMIFFCIGHAFVFNVFHQNHNTQHCEVRHKNVNKRDWLEGSSNKSNKACFLVKKIIK